MLPIKLRVNIKINTPTLVHLRQLGDGVADVDTSSLENAMAAIYRAFARRRFIQQSKGGGDWPPLAFMRKRNYNQALKQSKRILGGAKRSKKLNTQEVNLAIAMHYSMAHIHRPFIPGKRKKQ